MSALAQKRLRAVQEPMSALGQERTSPPLFEDLVGEF